MPVWRQNRVSAHDEPQINLHVPLPNPCLVSSQHRNRPLRPVIVIALETNRLLPTATSPRVYNARENVSRDRSSVTIPRKKNERGKKEILVILPFQLPPLRTSIGSRSIKLRALSLSACRTTSDNWFFQGAS